RSALYAGQEASKAVDTILAGHPIARSIAGVARNAWSGQFDAHRSQEHLFSAPEFELWQVHSTACIESNEFSLFAHRFQRRLKACGFGLRFPYALSQALIEMTENV